MTATYELKLIVGRKLKYFDGRINDIYERHGFSHVPFERHEIEKMISECQDDLRFFFERVFVDKDMAAHLTDKFYSCAGNVYEFFCELDETNMDALLTRNW